VRWFSDWELDWNVEWFGLDQDPTVFEGFGPGGVATVVGLQNGFTVTYDWITDVIKARSGREQRISRNDRARESYAGSALLLGDNPRAMRAKMARYSALGSAFLLGLPHEQLTLRADSSGATIYVHDTSYSDWAKPGQRVVVAREGGSFVDAVIQSAGVDSIVLDVAPGAVGEEGCFIMPTVPIYLEPQQDFPRYAITAEIWNLQARAATVDFSAPTLASLALGPITASAAFDNVIVYAREFGLAGNGQTFSLSNIGIGAGMLIDLAGFVQFMFEAGVTTLGDLATALDGSSYLKLGGTYNPADTIAAGDAFSFTALSGASEVGDVGTGATLTTYATHPVWDRQLDIETTNTDGVHGMTQILDHGGVPYSLGTADHADWVRALRLIASLGVEWQWWKLFMVTVKGRQKAFWLPTWRDDMTFVSQAAGEIVIESDDGSDFFAWWPEQRQHVQVVEADGTITYAEVTAAVDNGDGTITLTVDNDPASANISMISWLELCRMESDSSTVTFSGTTFSVSAVARVVQG